MDDLVSSKNKGLIDTEGFRFLIVGGSGVILGWFIYNIFYFFNPFDAYKATITWSISYIFGVWQQHALHWKFTFDTSGLNYFGSLKGSYFAYSFGLVVSVLINFVLVETVEIHHQLAWIFSVGSSVIVNFTFLKKYAFPN